MSFAEVCLKKKFWLVTGPSLLPNSKFSNFS